ncbi:DUF4190 domain-containing protein [Streptomyces dubilierae]|uniref:DUF4190 domain-containing protein n=1 Tax=Streptomyces dubilierae TaxID=3075533 RepID=A0ABU2PA46_9ACTN|nr:DUF4190 domain-containing protein [Streptomyces sp. DSM 41921]MDT0389022.1 DUF4190 domain-containing protein [Streptomyces sp. DSM 41921]
MTSYGGSPAASSGSRTNGMAIASLCCGIVGLFILNIILGPLAIVFGVVARRQGAGNGAGMAKAGIILGIVAVVLWLVMLAVASSNGGFSWYVGG